MIRNAIKTWAFAGKSSAFCATSDKSGAMMRHVPNCRSAICTKQRTMSLSFKDFVPPRNVHTPHELHIGQAEWPGMDKGINDLMPGVSQVCNTPCLN